MSICFRLDRKERKKGEIINRQQNRLFEKYLKSTALGQKSKFQGDPFIGGEKVKLNVNQIKKHVTWKRMTPQYKQFVLTNQDTVFTVELDKEYAEIEHNQVVCLKEDPSEVKFLFVNADLKRVIEQ